MVALGLVVATFNRSITERMEETAVRTAESMGSTVVETVHVPGSFDTPLAADRLARRPDIDAVVVLGAIITGDTDHDQVIGHAATAGLTDVSLERDTPVALGITGPGMSAEEGRERIDRAADAVESAIAMVESTE